jgi:hypothetical protein
MPIGTAAALLVLNGHITGISGIVDGLIGNLVAPGKMAGRIWRTLFIADLLLAGPPWRFFRDWTLPVVDIATTTLILAGLLVRLGTRYGRGCSSGQGVCGLARGSVRSLAATATFMGPALSPYI